MEDSNIHQLRRFLFGLPAQYGFSFNAHVRKHIRKKLFLVLTDRGNYLNWLFPDLYYNPHANQPQDILIPLIVDQIDKEFDWKLSNYYKSNIYTKNTKYQAHSHAFHLNHPCSRIFRKGEPIYRCLTCGYDDTCALCANCYQEEFHQGHKVHVTICLRENGGVCDCGDPEAWVNDFFCPYAAKDNSVLGLNNVELPVGFGYLFSKTIQVLLDYVIDVMSHSDLQYLSGEEMSTEFLNYYSLNSSLDAGKYGFSEDENATDVNSDEFCLMVYNDQVRHYRDAIQRIRLATKKVHDFAVMVADKAQYHGKAVVLSSKDLGLLKERQEILGATGLATSIRSRRDIFREDMCDEILIWINSLTESEVFKTNTSIKNIFCGAFCKRWNNGLLSPPRINSVVQYKTGRLDYYNKIPKVPSKPASPRTKYTDHWYYIPKLWSIPPEICQECNYNLTIDDYLLDNNHFGSRIQYLFYMDIRFWKSIRASLHDMYLTSLITNLEYKLIIECQYVDIYPAVADMFLTMDREAELNIMGTLSTQLFTCPSNSTSIMKHGDLSRIFAAIYGFLTVEEIRSPQNLEVCHEVSMKSLKNRRWGQIFFDIGYILSRSEYSAMILSPDIIGMACDILALFQGRPVLRRESKAHIEYESPDYTAFFHAILVIYQFGEHISRCLITLKEKSSDQDVASIATRAIGNIYSFLLKMENNDYPGLIDQMVDINLDTDKPYEIDPVGHHEMPLFNIASDKVSFLHPVHSFLSWIIEFSDHLDVESLRQIITDNNQLYLLQKPMKIYETFLFDYSLRTIVLMSQIKSGFWVRNGFSVKSQLQLYKGTSLRESGYMRDIYLSQVFANICSPDLFCYAVFNRWLLLKGWILDDTSTPIIYEPKVIPFMVEECLNFLIHVLTEDLHLRQLSEQGITRTRIQNEIIHNLCFGQMSYSKLCSCIPDHIIAEKQFDIIFEELTVFIPPHSSKDVGCYRLKDEYFKLVNPYYFNYSSNTRDDAVKLVKKRLGNADKPETAVVVPQLRDPQQLGGFRYVGNFSVSIYFSDFIIRTVLFVIDDNHNDESLLETLLHLLHICVFENNLHPEVGSFFDNFVRQSSTFATSISHVLYQLLITDKFRVHHGKIRAIFSVVGAHYDVLSHLQTVPDFNTSILIDNDPMDSAESESDRKKRIARAKQAKLMAKFKKQQSVFLRKNLIMKTSEVSDTELEQVDQLGWQFPENHCILCQNTSNNVGPFGIISHMSKSSIFRSVPFDDKYWFLKAFSDNANLDVDETDDTANHVTVNWRQYMQQVASEHVIGPGFTRHECVDTKVVSQSCGHGMHFQCYLDFIFSNRNKLNQVTRNAPENVDHKEFLCPLCKALGNMFVPIASASNVRDLQAYLAPGPIDHGDLAVLASLRVHDVAWLQEFMKLFARDLEIHENLTPTIKDLIGHSGEPFTPSQQQFRLSSSHITYLMTFYAFPSVHKTDFSTVISDTIKAVEISLRGQSSNRTLVVHQLSENSLINLRSLNELRVMLLYESLKNPKSSEKQFEPYLATLSGLRTLTELHSGLETDYFAVLNSIFPCPSAGFLFHVILEACFTAHVIQHVVLLMANLVAKDFDLEEYSVLDIPTIVGIDDNTAKLAARVFTLALHGGTNTMVTDHVMFGHVFYSMLIKACTPFLRRAAILSYVVCAENCGVPPECSGLEADRLCEFLRTERVGAILGKLVDDTPSFAKHKFESFLSTYKAFGKDDDGPMPMEYPGLIRLVDLPQRLDFFFTRYYYLDKYNNPHTTIEEPAICLFCGEVVDAQRIAVGSQQGECTTHYLKECLNHVGIFLLPKDKAILLLHKNGGSFIDAPYLDKHGELPGESKRSKTLHLMKSRYTDITRRIWLEHNVANYIVRKLDGVIDAGGWDTL